MVCRVGVRTGKTIKSLGEGRLGVILDESISIVTAFVTEIVFLLFLSFTFFRSPSERPHSTDCTHDQLSQERSRFAAVGR